MIFDTIYFDVQILLGLEIYPKFQVAVTYFIPRKIRRQFRIRCPAMRVELWLFA